MNGKHLALTERDRQVLSEVGRFGVMTREQLMSLRLFRSKTRANARLKKLTDAGYLTSRRQPLERGGPRLIYFPGTKLHERGVSGKFSSSASDLFLLHQLGLVDIRLAFEQHTTLSRWLSERELASLSLGLTPDAFLEFTWQERAYCAFVEYDRGTETLGRIERKIRAYLDLAFSGRFERTFTRKFFRVLLLTDSVGRLMSLSRTVRLVTDRLVRVSLQSDLTAHGPLASIWRRPGSQQCESLTNQ